MSETTNGFSCIGTCTSTCVGVCAGSDCGAVCYAQCDTGCAAGCTGTSFSESGATGTPENTASTAELNLKEIYKAAEADEYVKNPDL
jgi:hypothetical protein